MHPDRSVLIHGGRVIDPVAGFDGFADVLVHGDRIISVATSVHAPEAHRIDARGQIICPGFIDLHTHLRFPGFPEKETVASGSAAAAAGGFTTICAMANTQPVVDTTETLALVTAEVERHAMVRVRQLAAVTMALGGHSLTDMRALAAAGAVAFSDDGKPIRDGVMMSRALKTAASREKAISVHEEDPLIVGHGVANAGESARRLGLSEWPCTGEESMVERDLALLERSGGHLHIAHVSCAGSIQLIRDARQRGLHVTAEVTPHHLTLTDQLLEGDQALNLPAGHPCTKVNPPLRSALDVATLIDALAEGVIDCVATDHAPHAAADKLLPYHEAAFGISGLETALPVLLDLVVAGKLTLSTVIERLTAGPARVFKLPGGTIKPGAPADICIFDPGLAWRADPVELRSRGKNTPLLHVPLVGRVTCTLVAGKVVHQL